MVDVAEDAQSEQKEEEFRVVRATEVPEERERRNGEMAKDKEGRRRMKWP